MLQCGLINADWKTVSGRRNNGLDPLIKYWVKPDVLLKSSSQVRTEEVFEGDQVGLDCDRATRAEAVRRAPN